MALMIVLHVEFPLEISFQKQAPHLVATCRKISREFGPDGGFSTTRRSVPQS